MPAPSMVCRVISFRLIFARDEIFMPKLARTNRSKSCYRDRMNFNVGRRLLEGLFHNLNNDGWQLTLARAIHAAGGLDSVF